MAETFVQRQVRLVLEQQCRAAADSLKAQLPAGTGFALFIFDFGATGNVAYVSNGTRETVMDLLANHLERELRARGIDPDEEPGT